MIGGPIVFRFQVTPFVILFVERAGSTFLITSMQAHPDFVARTEKFDAMRQQGATAAEQLRWANEFLTAPLIGRHRAIGFKTKLVDVLDRDGFASLLRQRGCKILQLQRSNAIKAVVSTLNARRQWKVSGNWNRLSDATKLSSFSVDLDEFDRLLSEREELDRDLEQYVGTLQLPTLRLTYEELLTDQNRYIDRALDFLNARKLDAPGATLKNTSDDLREAVVNFDQLRARYTGTRYEAMFDEVIVPMSAQPKGSHAALPARTA